MRSSSNPDAGAGTTPISPCPENARGWGIFSKELLPARIVHYPVSPQHCQMWQLPAF